MVHEIIWSDLALKTYIANITYLEQEWTEKEIRKFINDVLRKILILSFQPRVGVLTNKRTHVRKTVINKQIVLIYRYKPRKKQVELLHFFNTHQKPL